MSALPQRIGLARLVWTAYIMRKKESKSLGLNGTVAELSSWPDALEVTRSTRQVLSWSRSTWMHSANERAREGTACCDLVGRAHESGRVDELSFPVRFRPQG